MNSLILWKDIRLFMGKHERPIAGHKHPIIQLVVAPNDKFKSKFQKSTTWAYKKGLLIKPNYSHQCDATDVSILSLEIDPETSLGEWILKSVLQDESILEYPSERYGEINFELVRTLLKNESWNKLRAYFITVFRFEGEAGPASMDKRINRVLDHIHQHIQGPLSSSQLTEVATLSESRLLHLFKAEMGLPIRNYVLWYRLKLAIEKVIAGVSLTEAAYLAGFSDQPHLSRSCVKMIGVPPSAIIKNSKFVQVSILH